MKVIRDDKASNFVNMLLYSTESISALLFSLISISLIARHFGPEALSRFSVVQSVSTIFIVFATLGLEQFVIRDLNRNSCDAEYISSIMIGMCGGWIIYVTLVICYYIFFNEFSRDQLLIASVVITTLFLKVTFIKSYMQAKNEPKPVAMASLASRLLSIVYLIAGTHFDFTFDTMMIYLPMQALVLILLIAINQPGFIKLIQVKHFNVHRLSASVREASPLFFSTVLYYLYTQSDILMMSNLLDPRTVGIYSASIRIIPQAAFIGYVLVATFYKQMDSKFLQDKVAFEAYVKSLLSIHFACGMLMSIIVFLTSELIINILYGVRYKESAELLSIVCWSWVFILPATLYSRLLITLGLARYELIKMLIVAPIVLIFNYLAISRIGMKGCAFVFVLSYLIVDFMIYFLFKDTRHIGIMGLNALADIFTQPKRTFRTAISMMKARI